jgi:hypothetical protein
MGIVLITFILSGVCLFSDSSIPAFTEVSFITDDSLSQILGGSGGSSGQTCYVDVAWCDFWCEAYSVGTCVSGSGTCSYDIAEVACYCPLDPIFPVQMTSGCY